MTVADCVCCAAAANVALPLWSAAMTQAPGADAVSALPASEHGPDDTA